MKELENISESGTPESRLSDPKSVKDMVNNMVQADEKRAQVRSRVKGLVDGNAPYSSSELRRTGQSYRANINWRESESFLTMGMSAFFDVFSEVPHYATVRINHGDANDSEKYSRIITEEFDRMQKKDGSFDYLMQLSQHEMVLYGTGPLVFEDKTDWRCKPVKSADLLVPDGSKSNVSDWSMCVVRSTYQVHELFSYIKDEEAALAMGWDIASAKKAIMSAAPKGDGGGNKSWEYYQQEIRNNDLTYSSKCSVVEVAHVFYKEFPTEDHPEGAISHCIIDERGDGQKFLFRKINRYAKWSEAVHCMYYDKGDGSHHSVKGMGIKMYAALEMKNRLKCSLVDAALTRTAIHIQPDSPNDLNRTNVVQMGPYAIIPPGYSVQQTSAGGVLDAPMAVEKELEGLMQSNLSQYRQNLDKGGNPRTATEIDAIVSQQSVLGKTQLNRYYSQLDSFFSERYNRAINPDLTPDMAGAVEALTFQKTCIDRGVPRACFDKIDYVQATRTAGRGSAMERRAIMGQLMGIIEMLPETGRKHVLEDHIASMAGYHSLERYYPVPEEDIDMQEQQQEAARENALFKTGANIPVAGGDSHVIHTESHIQAAAEAAMAAQQGTGNPAEIANYLALVVRHTADHMDQLSKDSTRQGVIKGFNQQLQQLAQIAQQLGKQAAAEIQQQQQAAAEMQQLQGGMDPKDQLASAKMERDEARKDAKTMNDMERKSQKTEQDLRLKDAKTAQKMALEDVNNANTIGQR